MLFYSDADRTNSTREVINREDREQKLTVSTLSGDSQQGTGSAVRACTLMKRLTERELTKFQCQLSLEVMNGGKSGGVYTTAGRPFYSGFL